MIVPVVMTGKMQNRYQLFLREKQEHIQQERRKIDDETEMVDYMNHSGVHGVAALHDGICKCDPQ